MDDESERDRELQLLYQEYRTVATETGQSMQSGAQPLSEEAIQRLMEAHERLASIAQSVRVLCG